MEYMYEVLHAGLFTFTLSYTLTEGFIAAGCAHKAESSKDL